MKYDAKKLKGLFTRAYNNQMQDTDHADIKELIKKTFGNGDSTPDPSLLHQFNEVVVRTADEIAKPMVTDMLSLFANQQTAQRGNIVQLNIPQQHKAKVVWSATGSGVDLNRVAGKKHMMAVPAHLSTGFYYEPLSLVTDDVEYFQDLVNNLVDAKLKLYLDKVYEMIGAAVSSGKIPANNVEAGDNLTIAKYNKLASTISRVAGGKTIFVADTLLIDYFLDQQVTNKPNLLTDRLREEILTSLNPSEIGRTVAMNLTNPFTDESNSKTELPVNKGYMFSGGTNRKPFDVVEYGGMRQQTEQDIEDERVKMKISQDVSINLVHGNAIGVITENSAVSL
ncbi:hypothetical protein [Halobacillus litoralis]|uniref:hypothetical protein n=1 Tax=Halobacillus litoralis TaxID=45668 RepID=UPI001CD688FB|nr:hypothetical protein [Halobacillus litoralis]MCA1021640.1 hypothetical protein [Halobacillus litoralis]